MLTGERTKRYKDRRMTAREKERLTGKKKEGATKLSKGYDKTVKRRAERKKKGERGDKSERI